MKSKHSRCLIPVFDGCSAVLLLLLQARIKAKAIAINTFMPKNGYRPVEVNPYAQQRYTSYYIPPVYSPQQQFPLYSLIAPQAWSATHSFIDPTLVTPFHNNQFINGFTASHSFKPATSQLTVRHYSPRNRCVTAIACDIGCGSLAVDHWLSDTHIYLCILCVLSSRCAGITASLT